MKKYPPCDGACGHKATKIIVYGCIESHLVDRRYCPNCFRTTEMLLANNRLIMEYGLKPDAHVSRNPWRCQCGRMFEDWVTHDIAV